MNENDQTEVVQYKIEGEHVHEGILMLPSVPADHVTALADINLTRDDVIIASFSKSGTTWLQEITYLIHNGADPVEAASRPLPQRVPFLDYHLKLPEILAQPPRRLLKTHLQPHFLHRHIKETGTKAIIMMRNPKDTLVSFYHFYQGSPIFGCFPGTWNDFFELFKSKRLIYGDWFDFTLGWWRLRKLPNIMFLKYEDMKIDPAAQIRKVAMFCGKDLTSEQVEAIVKCTSFDAMKKNNAVNYSNSRVVMGNKKFSFMRKGHVGDWVNYFTEAQNQWFGELYALKMEGTGLEFTFEQ